MLRVLAIDTALGACSACIWQAGDAEPLARESILMERGHAEALLPLIDRLSSQVEGGFSSLDRVAVTVGPGSYTGLRVGIAAARGIGLAAGIPVIGVATLSAFLAPLMATERRGLFTAAIDAKHGQIYIQAIAPGGRAIIQPSLMGYRDAIRLLGSGPLVVTGSAAAMLAAEARIQGVEALVSDVAAAPDIAWVARLGAIADPNQALPKPLYLREPDAKPQTSARIARQ
jgi:tRNA threonylcarbamoyl adenosine modification protein YeaZ